jgi:hypothetical protein
MVYIVSIILAAVMMNMVMKMGMSSPVLIRAAARPRKYH